MVVESDVYHAVAIMGKRYCQETRHRVEYFALRCAAGADRELGLVHARWGRQTFLRLRGRSPAIAASVGHRLPALPTYKQRFLRQRFDAPRGDDTMVAGISFVIALDVAKAVDVVDHHAGRPEQSCGRRVAEPVDAFQPRAVAEVKALRGV